MALPGEQACRLGRCDVRNSALQLLSSCVLKIILQIFAYEDMGEGDSSLIFFVLCHDVSHLCVFICLLFIFKYAVY